MVEGRVEIKGDRNGVKKEETTRKKVRRVVGKITEGKTAGGDGIPGEV